MASKHKLIFAASGDGGFSPANVTAGWSVSFYINALDDSGSIAAGKATRMLNLLRAMMIETYSIPFVRIQQVTDDGSPTRRTFVYSVPVGSRAGLIPVANVPVPQSSSDSFDALNIRLQTLDGPHRTFLFRGFPDEITEGGGAYVPSATFAAAFAIFRAAFLNNADNWAMRQQAGGAAFNISDVDVSTRALALSPLVTISCPVGSFAEGQSVRISPNAGFPGLGGLWTINTLVSDTAGAVVIRLKPKRGRTVGLALAGGLASTIRKVSFGLVNLADAQPLRGTHKLTGRPFGLQRGRRKRTA